ncbi:zinc-binding dehydrogenase [Alkalicoccus chagannorensis]|nr:zinc-binding dehydrogenase [Alkalicoccus chagannorensis]
MNRLQSGSLWMPIYRTYPLEEASEAHRVVEERQSTGKVLLATEAGRKGAKQHG